MILVELLTLTPLELFCLESVVMAAPNEINTIQYSRIFSSGVFVYTKFKSGPISSFFVVAVPLVVRLGVELYAV
jgi:hypothetical protein